MTITALDYYFISYGQRKSGQHEIAIKQGKAFRHKNPLKIFKYTDKFVEVNIRFVTLEVYNRNMLQWYLAYGGWSLSSTKVFVVFLYRSRIPYVYLVGRLGSECLASFGKWVLLGVAVLCSALGGDASALYLEDLLRIWVQTGATPPRCPFLDFQGPRESSGNHRYCGALRVPNPISLLETSRFQYLAHMSGSLVHVSRRVLRLPKAVASKTGIIVYFPSKDSACKRLVSYWYSTGSETQTNTGFACYGPDARSIIATRYLIISTTGEPVR
ncbi:hypothetical protein M0802_012627 [Mischocyttarus mexicanus]|nr:hypothetical protein M0802_012627 [Mischocyttarus mexicanus]